MGPSAEVFSTTNLFPEAEKSFERQRRLIFWPKKWRSTFGDKERPIITLQQLYAQDFITGTQNKQYVNAVFKSTRVTPFTPPSFSSALDEL